MNANEGVAEFKHVDELIADENLNLAFVDLLNIATSDKFTNSARGSAWCYMGTMCSMSATFSGSYTDYGIHYYKLATRVDNQCYDAWWGIVAEYGIRHSDKNAYDEAIEVLRRDYSSLSKDLQQSMRKFMGHDSLSHPEHPG